MKMNIITEQLANKLPKDSKLKHHKTINPTNFNPLYKLLKSIATNEIYIIDATHIPNKEPGTIVQEIQKGYLMKDRLLRPSLVVVSKKPEKNQEKSEEKAKK